jgi:hypothetical protein
VAALGDGVLRLSNWEGLFEAAAPHGDGGCNLHGSEAEKHARKTFAIDCKMKFRALVAIDCKSEIRALAAIDCNTNHSSEQFSL